MKVVGLTGGIATGKSTVARLLRERGYPVADADQFARDVVAPGTSGLSAIMDRFGAHIQAEDGTLDRAALRAIVLADPAARRELEAITHPLIRDATVAWFAGQADQGVPVAFLEAALLVETGSYSLYPFLVVVTCAPERQRQRLMARNKIGPAEADRWIAAQLPLHEKESVATHIIRNDGTLDALKEKVAALTF
ncbi:MAG: dephospho-CoA kinase [Deltaproteobacteria bacterium]|nr:dephospho-CoA kinase [Deltaproteobacteria bacterium]HCH66670.1 dephospho-CoA kinase [Deltaproteobacteria bacterium]